MCISRCYLPRGFILLIEDTNGHQTEQPTEGNAGEDVGSRNPKVRLYCSL